LISGAVVRDAQRAAGYPASRKKEIARPEDESRLFQLREWRKRQARRCLKIESRLPDLAPAKSRLRGIDACGT
jgi:hypothetical protein